MIGQLTRFGLVGIFAMLVHWVGVSLLVPTGLPPLIANIFGFLIAFIFSYMGHSRWTFSSTTHKHSLHRFFIIASSSFLINEGLFFILLRYTLLDYRTALAIVLLAVAVLTFVLSKFWAFNRT